jgi:flagellar basal-body rod modification protein FlgD
MAEVSPISSSSTTPRATGLSSLDADDFSKIIFAELSKQDPLQPNDTNALLQQLSTLRSIQSGMDLSSKLAEVVRQNEFASAATLVGKFVGGVDEFGDRASGQVKSISKTSRGATLELLDGTRIAMSNVDEIEGDRPASDEEARP